jgi:hypothetical protein
VQNQTYQNKISKFAKSPASRATNSLAIVGITLTLTDLSFKVLSNNLTSGDVLDATIAVGLTAFAITNPWVFVGVAAYGALGMGDVTAGKGLNWTLETFGGKNSSIIDTSPLLNLLKP